MDGDGAVMASVRETAIQALVAALAPTLADISRDTDIPERIPANGLLIVSEGELSYESMMSPLVYLCEQETVVEVHVVGVDEHDRDERLDQLLLSVSDSITTDRTLDGATTWVDIGAPEFEVYEADGAAKVARVPVTLSFTTTATPLT